MHLIGSILNCRTVRVQRLSLVTQSRHARILTLGYVPQGSSIETEDLFAGHGLSHLFYTDESKLYIAIEHSANIHSELIRIEPCVADIKNWMRHNMLKLNDDKTEFIVFASRYNQHLYSDVSLMIGNTAVVCEPQVKNLGVIFDQVMSMRQHVNYTSRAMVSHWGHNCIFDASRS